MAGRLTILVTSTQRRGAEVFGERLADGLPRRHWDVDFVALGAAREGSTVRADPLSAGPVPRLDPKVLMALRRRLTEHESQIVLANGSSTLQYGVLAARMGGAGRPLAVYSSIGEPTYWARSPRQRMLYRLLVGRADHVFSVAQATAAQLVDEFGVNRRKLTVVPTGVPEPLLEVEAPQRDGGLRVLVLGSLSREKDPLAALDTVAQVAEAASVEVRFVGDGPLRHDLESRASELGITPLVELVGSVEDVAGQLGWADVLLLTSRTEGLPAATLEAAAAGRPVVAFDVGGVAETMIDGESGILVDPGDTAAAAAALLRFGNDPGLRRAAGEAGRRLVRRHFTIEAALDRYDEALRSLLEGSAR